jgi:hypothetical protein
MKNLMFLIILCLAGGSQATTYYLDVTTGNDTDTGLTEALAWQTFDKACRSLTAGDTVYVKASASYTAVDTNDANIDINEIGTATAANNFIGYSSTIYDGGIVEVNAATTTNAYCITSNNLGNLYYKFSNFRFTGATSHGVYAGKTAGADDNLTFINCKFDNNGGDGFNGDTSHSFINCLFIDNAGDGLQVTSGLFMESCISFSNTATGVTATSSANINNSLFAENLGDQLVATLAVIADGCTFDGNDVANSDGMSFAATGGDRIINCIFYDCAKGVNNSSNRTYRIDRNNCYWSCGAANTNWPDPADADAALRNTFTASSDPFVSVGSITAYVLAANTPNTGAKYGALDAGHCATFWNSYLTTNPPTGANAAAGYNDIGAKQRVDPAGGTTTTNYYILSNKNGGKQ